VSGLVPRVVTDVLKLRSLAVPGARVAYEIWELSLDFSIFVVPPDSAMSTPVAFRERGLKEDSLDLGVSAFSGFGQYVRRVGAHWTVGPSFMDSCLLNLKASFCHLPLCIQIGRTGSRVSAAAVTR